MLLIGVLLLPVLSFAFEAILFDYNGNSYGINMNVENNIFSLNFPYFTSTQEFNFCLRKYLPIASGQSCSLNPQTDASLCIKVNLKDKAQSYSIYSHNAMTTPSASDFTAFGLPGNTASTTSIATSIATPPSRFILPLAFLSPLNVYELQVSFTSSGESKVGFISTYSYFQDESANDFLMQRNCFCTTYFTYTVMIFYGGIYRSGANRLMVTFITTDSLSKLNMWGGLSFSKDHANRDMIGFISSDGSLSDLQSLFKSTPYEDTSISILGNNDVTKLSQSNPPSSANNHPSSENNPFHSVTLVRQYDTGDVNGDEIIRYKMNNQFCFAGYFASEGVSVSFLNQTQGHQLLSCFEPVLTVDERLLKVMLLLTVLLMG